MKVLAVYGSPRRRGNTSLLLKKAVEGASEAGAEVEEIVLRDLKMVPCLEIYGCKKAGRCVIQDDFQRVYDQLLACRGLMLASPIFFYAVSAHTKVLMDRCQSLWVKKYWIDKVPFGQGEIKRKGLFISAGATSGKSSLTGHSSACAISLMSSIWKSGEPCFIAAWTTKGTSCSTPSISKKLIERGRN